MDELRERVVGLAAEAAMTDDPFSWFEQIYTEANGDWTQVPWEDQRENPLLSEWFEGGDFKPSQLKCLIVGCGLGDDAAYLADLGCRVTAFDISETAIEWAQRIYSGKGIQWHTANLLDLPVEWNDSFDLVVEIHILQAMPWKPRDLGSVALPKLVNKGGFLVSIGRLCEPGEEIEGPPWPLTKDWLFAMGKEMELEDFIETRREDDEPETRRYRAVWRNPC